MEDRGYSNRGGGIFSRGNCGKRGFSLRDTPVGDQHQDNTAADGSIGDIKNRPAGQMISEDIDIKEIRVDEIDHAAVKERAFAEEPAIEHAIDKVADCSSENHREGKAECDIFIPGLIEVDEDSGACDNGKDREKQFAADIDAERHTGILDIGEAEKIADDGAARTERQSVEVDAKPGQVQSLDPEFGQLIGDNDKEANVEYFHLPIPRPITYRNAICTAGTAERGERLPAFPFQ